ncbi:hypothetical protein WJ966_27955 [Achromobacter xylosoxidans]
MAGFFAAPSQDETAPSGGREAEGAAWGCFLMRRRRGRVERAQEAGDGRGGGLGRGLQQAVRRVDIDQKGLRRQLPDQHGGGGRHHAVVARLQV